MPLCLMPSPPSPKHRNEHTHCKTREPPRPVWTFSCYRRRLEEFQCEHSGLCILSHAEQSCLAKEWRCQFTVVYTVNLEHGSSRCHAVLADMHVRVGYNVLSAQCSRESPFHPRLAFFLEEVDDSSSRGRFLEDSSSKPDRVASSSTDVTTMGTAGGRSMELATLMSVE